MLTSLYQLKEVLPSALNRLDRRDVPMLYPSDWCEIKELIDILQPFDDITKELSAEKYITISKVIPLIKCLSNKLNGLTNLQPLGNQLKASLLEGLNYR